MIKSCIAILLMLCMMLTLTGCNDSSNEQNKSSETDSTTTNTMQESSNENEPPKSDTEEENLYTNVEAFLDREIFINYRVDKYRVIATRVYTYTDANEYLTATVFGWPEDYTGNLDGTVEYLLKHFFVQVTDDVPGEVENQPANMTKTEQVTVNGFDAVRFSGTVNNTVRDYNFYGYSFLIKDAPIMVVGMVHSKVQEQELIDMMIEEVDVMAATIRTEE